MPEITYRPIGIVHSPYSNPEGTPIQAKTDQDNTAAIEIYPEYVEGLKDLNGFSHVYVLFHMHLTRARPLTVIPFLDTQPHGVFATRSPARPNPIGLSVVLLESISDNMLYIKHIDILDGSPVLDIKPYIMQFDVFETSRNGWLDGNMHKLAQQRDDGRFKHKQ
jgi:tRNA-Thr(GGU) m(6)t(6)A37 methyltransferase TsaA